MHIIAKTMASFLCSCTFEAVPTGAALVPISPATVLVEASGRVLVEVKAVLVVVRAMLKALAIVLVMVLVLMLPEVTEDVDDDVV